MVRLLKTLNEDTSLLCYVCIELSAFNQMIPYILLTKCLINFISQRSLKVSLNFAGWRFVAVAGYLILVFLASRHSGRPKSLSVGLHICFLSLYDVFIALFCVNPTFLGTPAVASRLCVSKRSCTFVV